MRAGGSKRAAHPAEIDGAAKRLSARAPRTARRGPRDFDVDSALRRGAGADAGGEEEGSFSEGRTRGL